MAQSLSSLVPNADDLLALEEEELAGVLLAHLNSFAGVSGNTIHQHGGISHHNFFHGLDQSTVKNPEYGAKQQQVNQALMEAWAWLQSEGLLVEKATSAGWFFLSRRAQRLKTRGDFDAYRKANLLPRGQLHVSIATKVYPAFLRGDYDTAIFQAFREVEIRVRQAGGFSADLVGVQLMRDAFKPAKNNNPPGPLVDTELPVAEQEAMASLYAGAIGLYKNPQSHRHVVTNPVDAAEVIGFASHLLRMVDDLDPQTREAKP